jgi:hypothetical protein
MSTRVKPPGAIATAQPRNETASTSNDDQSGLRN